MTTPSEQKVVRRDPPPGFELKSSSPFEGVQTPSEVKAERHSNVEDSAPEPERIPPAGITEPEPYTQVGTPKSELDHAPEPESNTPGGISEDPQFDATMREEVPFAGDPSEKDYTYKRNFDEEMKTRMVDLYDVLPSEERKILRMLLKNYGVRRVRAYMEIRVTVLQLNIDETNVHESKYKISWLVEAISRLTDKSLL